MSDRFPGLAGGADPHRRISGHGQPRVASPLGKGLAATVVGLLALIVPAAGLIIWLSTDHPAPLCDYHLSGARSVNGAVCLDVVADFSGSMEDSAETRNDAMTQLKPFMAREMRATDVLTMVRFAQTAVVTLPPTRIDHLGRSAENPIFPLSGSYTWFRPAIREADEAHDNAKARCAVRTLVAITDGEFADDERELPKLITHFRRVYWAIPDKGRNFRPESADKPGMAGVITRGFHDANELSELYGEALADATGQKLTIQAN